MKLMNFYLGEEVHLGLVTDGGVVDLTAAAKEAHKDDGKGKHHLCMEKFIAKGDKAKEWALSIAGTAPKLKEEDLKFAPVVTHPEKILCVGLNYLKHIQEGSGKQPVVPELFSKFNTALAAHNETIPIPKAAGNIDYEAEMVIVIGKEGFEIPEDKAMDYVFGYTVGNDLSARVQQFQTTQWLTGKSPDKFGPVGPYIVTKDAIDGGNMPIHLFRNGVMKQDSNTNDLLFGIEKLVSYASEFFTLKPGDIMFTGTPSGVIRSWGDPFLSAGDEVVVEIEGIGKLRNVMA